MKRKRIKVRTLAIYGLALLSGAMLLHTSQSVQKAEEKLHEIKILVDQEKESIGVLRTEWAYLNNPERLETLAKKYLDLKAPAPQQITTENPELPEINDIASPLSEEAQPVSYTPVSTAKPSALKSPSRKEPAPGSKSPPEKDFNTLMNQMTKEGAQ